MTARNSHIHVSVLLIALANMKEKVFILKAVRYDPQQIEAGVRVAAQVLGVSLPVQGNALLHADCPWAHPRFAPHPHTHTALIEGVARALSGSALTLAAHNAPEFPTRYSFKQAGYTLVANRLGAQLVAFDETGTRPIDLSPHAKVDKQARLPFHWHQATFRVSLPKLRGSTLVSFAGAVRHLQSLLPQDIQVKDSHRLPEKMADLLPAISPHLIIVDAIQALHKGGELSGEPIELEFLIIGTHPLAVDVVCATALGLESVQVDFLSEAATRGLGPTSLEEIELLGDLSIEEVRSRAHKVDLVDPDPAHYPLPNQVKIIRSEKARQSGASGALADVLFLLERAGVSLKSATETTIVIGDVGQIPPPRSDTATLIFMDDTSRAEYSGYSRIVRLPGRNIPISQLLDNVPYAMKVINLRAELGAGYMLAKLMTNLSRIRVKITGGRG